MHFINQLVIFKPKIKNKMKIEFNKPCKQIHGDIYDYLIKLTLHDTYKTYGIQSIRLMQFYYEKSQNVHFLYALIVLHAHA